MCVVCVYGGGGSGRSVTHSRSAHDLLVYSVFINCLSMVVGFDVVLDCIDS